MLLALGTALALAPGPTGCNRSQDDLEAPAFTAEARQHGRQLFVQHCALCHGDNADGHGVRRNLVGTPADFTDPGWRSGVTAEQVFRVIRDGKPGTSMSAWPSLDEQEIWDLTAYVLSVAGEAGD
jgi:mono/diheme cytochrome c family protein